MYLILCVKQTRSDILQGQALFIGVKQLRTMVMLNNFEKFSFRQKKKSKRNNDQKKNDKRKDKR